MCPSPETSKQSGGVNISGAVGSARDVVGRDLIIINNYGRNADGLVSSPSVSPGPLSAVSNVPVHVPRFFMGRDDALEAIEAAFERNKGRVAMTVLHGLRGIGKTALAAAFAERHRTDYRMTWWLRAQTEATTRADLVALGVQLNWVGLGDREEPALATVMQRLWLVEQEDFLLIYDNAIDARQLTPYLPQGGKARVLITSNAPNWRGVAEPVEIRLWSTAVGANYLIARTGGGALEHDAAEALSKTLGGLPLAHEQAAAYCERLGIALADYAEKFKLASTRLLDAERDAPVEYHDGLTVAKTFRIAIEQAAQQHAAAAPLIMHLALLAPEPVPLFLLREGRESLGEPLSSLLADDGLDEAVAALRGFALLYREIIVDEREPTMKTETVRLHRLVREIAAADISRRDDVQRALIKALALIYPNDGYNDLRTWPYCGWLLPHVLILCGQVHQDIPSVDLVRLFDAAGGYLHRRGTYTGAEALYRAAIETGGKTLGRKHSDVARSLNNLAHLCRDTDRYEAAETFYKEAIDIGIDALGPQDPRIATWLNNLGNLYRIVQRNNEAEKLIQRAIQIAEAKLGRRSHNVAVMLANFAGLLRDTQRYVEAEVLYKEAIDIGEETIGRRHANVATWLNSLADLYRITLRYVEAATHYEEAVDIGQETLGRQNPDVVSWFNNLSSLKSLTQSPNLIKSNESAAEYHLPPDSKSK